MEHRAARRHRDRHPRYVDPPDFLLRQRGAPALALGIVMQKGANILTLGEDVDAAMAEIMRATPVGFTYERIANQPKIVEEAVGDFMRSFVEALVIVLAVSFLSRAGVPASSSPCRCLSCSGWCSSSCSSSASICTASRSAR